MLNFISENLQKKIINFLHFWCEIFENLIHQNHNHTIAQVQTVRKTKDTTTNTSTKIVTTQTYPQILALVIYDIWISGAERKSPYIFASPFPYWRRIAMAIFALYAKINMAVRHGVIINNGALPARVTWTIASAGCRNNSCRWCTNPHMMAFCSMGFGVDFLRLYQIIDVLNHLGNGRYIIVVIMCCFFLNIAGKKVCKTCVFSYHFIRDNI